MKCQAFSLKNKKKYSKVSSAAVVISTSLVFEGALSIGSAQIVIESAILLIPRESNCLYKCSISMVERDSHCDVTGWICYLFLFPKL